MNYKIKAFYRIVRYDIWRFIKNIFVYRKALWSTYRFDYAGSLYYLRTHLEQLEPVLRNGHHVNGTRDADKVKTCKLLLDRILNHSDQYSLDNTELDMSSGRFKLVHTPKNTEHPRYGTKTYWSVTRAKEQQDWDFLMKILHKDMRSFWN
jgi:hypothetical protein